MDFTYSTYKALLASLQAAGYTFQPFAEYITSPAGKVVILRHDVDKRPGNSLVTAKTEHELGIRGTYYFRIVPCSFNPEIINEIHSLGHEIGYHYEDINLVSGNHNFKSESQNPEPGTRNPEPFPAEEAIRSFSNNLKKLRNLAPIVTACMHGSPLSRYDNRLLWDYYDYRDYGITGEPYFDTDFSKVLYLTDTGRTWRNKSISVRDKVLLPNTENRLPITGYRSTTDIIKAAHKRVLPPQLMLTIHPQRWSSNPFAWTIEFVGQNIKNIFKALLVRKGV